MKNYRSEENGVINFYAPAGGVMGGVPVVVGDLLLVPHHDAAEGELASGVYRGEFELAKVETDAAGQLVAAYWNADQVLVTTAADDGGGNDFKRIGFFSMVAASGDALAQVMLTGEL